jgi:hypothetical protein
MPTSDAVPVPVYGYVTPTGGFVVEVWFRHVAIPTYAEALFNQQTQNKGVSWDPSPAINGRQLLVYINSTDGFLHLEIRNTAGTLVASFIDTVADYTTDNAWHYLAVRLGADKRTVTMWLDAAVKYTVVMGSVLDWLPGVMSVGGTYAPHLGNFGTFLFNGGLAYFATFNATLNDTQILSHYTAGTGGTVFYGDNEVTRLVRLYSYGNVPVNAQRFEAAQTTLQGVQIGGQNGLATVLSTADDASGTVFADGQSFMVYQNRAHRYNRALFATLADSTSSAPDVGMEFSTDDTKVYNDVRASRPFGGTSRVRNLPSEFEYGRLVLELSKAITSDDEMRNAGTWVVNRYGVDRTRVSGVTLSAESSDLAQYVAENIALGDRVGFDDLPNNAPQTYQEFYVEGISVTADFKAQTWSVGLELSPAELWNVLQVSVSTLGDGSRIAF